MAEKYATREMHGGLDWRTLAKEMENHSVKISPSRARGLFLSTMEKFAEAALERIKGKSTPEEVRQLSRDPSFQCSIGRILRLAYLGSEDENSTD